MSMQHSSEGRNRCWPRTLAFHAGLAFAAVAAAVLWVVVVHPAPLPPDQIAEPVPEIKTRPPQPQPESGVKVLVARKDLNMGTILTSPVDSFEEKLVAKEAAADGAIHELGMLAGRVLKRGRQAGSCVTLDDLLPPKMRPIGVPVRNSHVLPEGGAAAGARVDILHVECAENSAIAVIKVLLQDVLVLHNEPSYIRPEGGSHGLSSPCVTVAVPTPDDVLAVALAFETGTLRLVVRTPPTPKTIPRK
jgi:Flp pilus assembly protein CpaB